MRVLVTAATRHEATAELAAAIAAALRRRDIDAQARAIGEVAEVGGYDAVVLGSAVYVGRWLREARRFAESNAATLATMPVWLFSSGPVGPGGESGPADADTLAELTGAREHRVFAGRLDRQRLGLGERFVVRLARAPARDDRDWAAIEDFAADIADALRQENGAGATRDPVGLRTST